MYLEARERVRWLQISFYPAAAGGANSASPNPSAGSKELLRGEWKKGKERESKEGKG